MTGSERIARIVLAVAIAFFPVLVIAKWIIRPDGDPNPTIPRLVSVGIALISVDDLEPADLPSYFSRSTPKTPAVSELRRLGILVRKHFGAADRDVAATASLITGLLPSVHHVISARDHLAPSALTLGQLAERAELPSAAFSNTKWLSECDLGRGFAKTTEVGVPGNPSAEDAAAVGSAAADWLRSVGAAPSLLWVHVHPPEGGGAAALDAVVDAVTRGLEDARQLEGTYIVAVGTHGDRVDRQTPFLCRIPGRMSAGADRNGPSSNLDIVPTILQMIGLPQQPRLPGRSLTGGKDQPLVTGNHFNDFAAFEWIAPDTRAIRTGLAGPRFAIVREHASNQDAVYDLNADPLGTTDLRGTAEGDRVWDAMRPQLDAVIAHR